MNHIPSPLAVPTAAAGAASSCAFRSLADCAPALMWSCDASGRCVYVNAAWLAFTGRSQVEELGDGFVTALHPDDRERCVAQIAESIAARRPLRMSCRARRADGAWRWLDASAAPHYAADGSLDGYLGVSLDVTERHAAAEAAASWQERYRRASSAVGQLLFEWDPASDAIVFAPGIRELLGYPVERLHELRDLYAIVHADDRARVRREFEASIAAGARFQHEFRALSAGNAEVLLRLHGSLVRDAHGVLRRAVGFVSNVSAWREREREREFHAHVLEHLSEGVTVTDDQGTIQFANAAMVDMFGYSRGELLGRWVNTLNADPPGRQAEILAQMRAAAAAGPCWRGELNSLRKDGTRFVSRATVAPFEYDGTRWWIAIRRDVSEHKRLQQAVLDARRQEQQRIASDLHDGLGQELTGLSFLVTALRRELRTAPGVADALADIGAVLENAIALCRSTAEGIAAFGLGHDGLRGALELLAARKRKIYGAQVDVQVDAEAAAELGSTVEYELYQIAKEAVRNAFRHGRANVCRVSFVRDAGVLELAVCDDGTGFDPRVAEGRGLGLRIMVYRAEQIGASLVVESSPGAGTGIRCRLAA